MSALLEKLNTASPARVPNVQSSPKGDTLQHSVSVPSGLQKDMNNPVSPPAQTSNPAEGNLTATLKQMLGLHVGATGLSSPSANPSTTSNAGINGTSQATYPQPGHMTPTRTPALTADSRYQHTATPPAQHQQIHLAPALSTPLQGQSPLLRPSLPGSQQTSFDGRPPYPQHTFSNSSYPEQPNLNAFPSQYPGQYPPFPTYASNPQMQTQSPRPPPGLVASASQNGTDVFAARSPAFDHAAATKAVATTWANRAVAANPNVNGPAYGEAPLQPQNLDQKREFMNGLMGAIHVSAKFGRHGSAADVLVRRPIQHSCNASGKSTAQCGRDMRLQGDWRLLDPSPRSPRYISSRNA